MKVEWEDDWPVFNDGNNITLETKGRGLLSSATGPTNQKWEADLSRDILELGWYQKSTCPAISILAPADKG